MVDSGKSAVWSWRKKLTFALYLIVVSGVLTELLLRVFYAISVGPDVLLYGFVPSQQQVEHQNQTVALHENTRPGYSKYYPNQKRVDFDADSGEIFDVTINSSGFRGGDFEREKPEGVVRIVTLGASSTFGYHSRDGDTYPQQLGRELRDRCGPEKAFEVINLGIPHLNSGEIFALFIAEALPLDPDIVTFYEGINDTIWPLDRNEIREKLRARAWLKNTYRAMRDRLLLVRLADHIVSETRWLAPPSNASVVDLEGLDDAGSQRADRFVRNLAQIREESRDRGIPFIVVTQQAKSRRIERARIRGVTYSDEVEILRNQLSERQSLSRTEIAFLHHAAIVRAEKKWTSATGVPLVDAIAALDDRRDVLATWVHLTPEGNRMIASALADEIQKHVCDSARP